MKKLIAFCVITLFVSCNDGDLQIETIDFDSVGINTCESTITTASTIFFKLNGKESLILELQSGVLKNEASSDIITSLVPGQSKITYRAFSDNVTSNYFCDAIPNTTPLVIEEIEAQDGEVLITTVLAEGTTNTYEHTIELSGITFITAQDERITDLQINEFGTITTSE